MTLADAGFAFFLNVSDFPAGCHLAISADHAAAAERGEAEKPNETHRVLRLNRRAIYVPRPAFAASWLRRGRRACVLLRGCRVAGSLRRAQYTYRRGQGRSTCG